MMEFIRNIIGGLCLLVCGVIAWQNNIFSWAWFGAVALYVVGMIILKGV